MYAIYLDDSIICGIFEDREVAIATLFKAFKSSPQILFDGEYSVRPYEVNTFYPKSSFTP